ncbi:hypothetical protein C8J57DRAFT_1468493 [Mycena rebaudengoi]|nr:hypothetical protein C8J57DRAFT_1468493 [Mycena rebaudengoi]
MHVAKKQEPKTISNSTTKKQRHPLVCSAARHIFHPAVHRLSETGVTSGSPSNLRMWCPIWNAAKRLDAVRGGGPRNGVERRFNHGTSLRPIPDDSYSRKYELTSYLLLGVVVKMCLGAKRLCSNIWEKTFRDDPNFIQLWGWAQSPRLNALIYYGGCTFIIVSSESAHLDAVLETYESNLPRSALTRLLLAREIQSLVPRVQGERPALPRARWGPQIQINPRAHHIGPLERGTPPILPGQSHGGEPAFYVKRGKPSRGPVRGPPGGEEHYVQTRTCLSGGTYKPLEGVEAVDGWTRISLSKLPEGNKCGIRPNLRKFGWHRRAIVFRYMNASNIVLLEVNVIGHRWNQDDLELVKEYCRVRGFSPKGLTLTTESGYPLARMHKAIRTPLNLDEYESKPGMWWETLPECRKCYPGGTGEPSLASDAANVFPEFANPLSPEGVCHCRARGDGTHPQAPRGGAPAVTGRGIPTPAPVRRYRRAARNDQVRARRGTTQSARVARASATYALKSTSTLSQTLSPYPLPLKPSNSGLWWTGSGLDGDAAAETRFPSLEEPDKMFDVSAPASANGYSSRSQPAFSPRKSGTPAQGETLRTTQSVYASNVRSQQIMGVVIWDAGRSQPIAAPVSFARPYSSGQERRNCLQMAPREALNLSPMNSSGANE